MHDDVYTATREWMKDTKEREEEDGDQDVRPLLTFLSSSSLFISFFLISFILSCISLSLSFSLLFCMFLFFRRMKEKYELTEVHKQLNRMQFGVEEDQNGLKGINVSPEDQKAKEKEGE